MHMHVLNTCKQLCTYRRICVLHFVKKITAIECPAFCAHDVKYAHGNNSCNIDRSLDVVGTTTVGTCMD